MQIRIPPVRITLHGIKEEECDIPKKKSEKQTFILAGGEKTYEAQKPFQAALKAFYAKHTSQNDYKKDLSNLEKQILRNNIELQKTNKNKVYRYNVRYVCNLNPNKHELEHCITRKAVAVKL